MDCMLALKPLCRRWDGVQHLVGFVVEDFVLVVIACVTGAFYWTHLSWDESVIVV